MIAIQSNQNARLPPHLTVPRGLEMNCQPAMEYYTLAEIERPLPTVEDHYLDDDQVDILIGLVSLGSTSKSAPKKRSMKNKASVAAAAAAAVAKPKGNKTKKKKGKK